MTNLTNGVSDCFICAVGLTRPKARQERRAALYITATLIGAEVAVAGFFLFLAGGL